MVTRNENILRRNTIKVEKQMTAASGPRLEFHIVLYSMIDDLKKTKGLRGFRKLNNFIFIFYIYYSSWQLINFTS